MTRAGWIDDPGGQQLRANQLLIVAITRSARSPESVDRILIAVA
jgi:hypothetical protein